MVELKIKCQGCWSTWLIEQHDTKITGVLIECPLCESKEEE